jgi:hypothetical protein
MEIFRRLAHAMGYTEPELYESDAGMIETLLERSGLGLDFAALAAEGTVPLGSDAVVQFADLEFPTSSGRVELGSAAAEAAGLPRHALPLVDERPTRRRLRLLTPASPWLLNDSFCQRFEGRSAPGTGFGRAEPGGCVERGLTEGDEALGHEHDRQPAAARDALGRAATRRRVLAERPLAEARAGSRERQRAEPGERADMGGSTCVHGVEVTVAPAG